MPKKGTLSMFGTEIDAQSKRSSGYAAQKQQAEIFRLFGKYPFYWHRNKEIIAAARRLAETKRASDIQAAVTFAIQHRNEMYCPKIYTPLDLERKWSNLYHYITESKLKE